MDFSDLIEASRISEYLLFIITISFVCVAPVYCAQEIRVFRLQQIDISGEKFGSRVAAMSLQAVAGVMSSTVPPSRQCLMLRLVSSGEHEAVPSADVLDRLRGAVDAAVGGLVLLLPPLEGSTGSLNLTELQQHSVLSVEQYLMSQSFSMPIYLTYESDELVELYESIYMQQQLTETRSSLEALLSVLTSTGRHLETSGALVREDGATIASSGVSQPTAQLFNIDARLHGNGAANDALPTVLIVAHYDVTAMAPALAFGADSNGSGVAALLELARIFGRLYGERSTRPLYNVAFVLAAGGQLNYAGSRRWLDDNAELLEAGTVAGEGIQFVMCLDSIGDGQELNMHVSKPPRPQSAAGRFYQMMSDTAEYMQHKHAAGAPRVGMVHKKINLADSTLSWEHESYSIRRLPAFTVSHYKSGRSAGGWRSSLFDTNGAAVTHTTATNTRLLALSLAQLVFNVTPASVAASLLHDQLDVSEDGIGMWLHLLTSSPRSSSLLTDSAQDPIASFTAFLNRHTHSVRVTGLTADRRQPEWLLYDTARGGHVVMHVRHVKTAGFELLLSLMTAGYLACVYALVVHFPLLLSVARRVAPVVARQATD